MSEYQYYEFQTIDRPLTTNEMAELRALSTRARITPTSFQNVYNFGDFKGEPDVVLSRYFDAFVYDSNFGLRQLAFRMPPRSIDDRLASPYLIDSCVSLRTNDEHDIVEFVWRDEGGDGDWHYDEESEGWMPALLPLRSDLMDGDRRSFYLAWLSSIQWDFLDDEDEEPPVPAGLRQLSPSLQMLATFLEIDADLIAVAAEPSASLQEPRQSLPALKAWVQALPDSEKDVVLARLVDDAEPATAIQRELLQRFRREHAPAVAESDTGERRTVAALLAAASARVERRRREQTEQAAQARARFLDDLADREEDTWDTVELFIQSKRPADYDRAVALLIDLRDLARHKQTEAAFDAELRGIRLRHATKPSLMGKLDQAKLRPA